jgi:membrane associated rhomboid family serine protease
MILPLGDAPNPRGVPLVTYGLIAANVAVFLLVSLPLGGTAADPSDPLLREYVRVVGRNLPEHVSLRELVESVSAYDLFVFRYGFRPAAPRLSALFASLFLHAGFLHLFGNMLFLWIYGDNVEHRLGHLAYLLGYIGTGVAATVFHTVFSLGSELPVVGASGAISGVLGFYFLWFPRNRVRLLVLMFPFFMDVFLVPARLVLGMYLLIDNLLPFLVTRGIEGGGVAYGAHIGGFVAGLGAAWLMDRREVVARPREYRVERRRAEPVETLESAVRAALAEGRFRDAARLYFALDAAATRHLLSPEESLALGGWLHDNGHPEAALAVFRRHLRDYPRGPGLAEAHLGAGLVQLHDLREPTPAYQHFLDVLEAEPSPEVAAQARAALQAISGRQKFQIGRPRGRGLG